jgi:bacterioferritin (cytochrome b1)
MTQLISRSKAIQLLIESKKFNSFSKEELQEILNDSEEAYYDTLETPQLELELGSILNSRIQIVND